MTRKDYVLLAKAITDTRNRIATDPSVHAKAQLDQQRGVRRTAAHICDALAADNPRFDAGQFLSACGYGATTMNPRDPALDLRPLREEYEAEAQRLSEPDARLVELHWKPVEDETDAQCERERSRRAWAAREETVREPRRPMLPEDEIDEDRPY